jgi:hypothetical protein
MTDTEDILEIEIVGKNVALSSYPQGSSKNAPLTVHLWISESRLGAVIAYLQECQHELQTFPERYIERLPRT